MMTSFKQSYPTFIIVFVIAFLLGYGTSARIVNRSKSNAQKETASASDATQVEGEKTAVDTNSDAGSALAQISASVGAGISTVSADNQAEGEIVSVVVKAEKETWVAIHEETDGKLGKILGAQLFTKGTHTGLVHLLRPTVAGMKYSAMLHADNGDRKFDPAEDKALMASTGGMIMDEFMASIAGGTQ